MKNSRSSRLLLIDLYMILSVLFAILYIPNHQIVHFGGASSIIEAFITALFVNSRMVSVALFTWSLLATGLFIWFYFLVKIKGVTKPFLVIAGIDLFVSLCLGLFSNHIANNPDNPLITGAIIRTMYYILCFMLIRDTGDNRTVPLSRPPVPSPCPHPLSPRLGD